MLPENIDDLFRDKLDGHETPPGPDLWARLQAGPAAPAAQPATEPAPERLDQLFQNRLNGHATPPARELWERLEDEHLRPRKRRAAAWWPMALAAAVVLFLLAGGAGLWLGFPAGKSQRETVASHPAQPAGAASGLDARRGSGQSVTPGATTNPYNGAADTRKLAVAAAITTTPDAAALPAQNPSATVAEKKSFSQATRSETLASTAPKARMTAAGQSPRHKLGTRRQPDAAAVSLPVVAHTTTRPDAADEPHPALTPAPIVATVTPQTAPEIVRAVPNPIPAVAANELITVDVRNGAAPASRPARPITSALAEAGAPRQLGGRLLRQAGRLVRGERVSLADVTGLPENVTLRATIAGRSVSKSIQL